MKQGKHILVACCDSNLLGKILKEGKINFEVKKDFYGGKLVHIEEAIVLLKDATTANLVGTIIINKAIKEGIVHPQSVIRISNVPHALILKN